mmetsp:Transcript_56770/g.93939  ORF Transcript_56770/g.93939 Transcript_56770/m.93939 type:complete len:248 (+) Transcript_56770:366-1109(+)
MPILSLLFFLGPLRLPLSIFLGPLGLLRDAFLLQLLQLRLTLFAAPLGPRLTSDSRACFVRSLISCIGSRSGGIDFAALCLKRRLKALPLLVGIRTLLVDHLVKTGRDLFQLLLSTLRFLGCGSCLGLEDHDRIRRLALSGAQPSQRARLGLGCGASCVWSHLGQPQIDLSSPKCCTCGLTCLVDVIQPLVEPSGALNRLLRLLSRLGTFCRSIAPDGLVLCFCRFQSNTSLVADLACLKGWKLVTQ